MSAVVCGKRSNFFEDSPSPPSVSKRIRCSSSSSPGRTFSPPRAAAASSSYHSSPNLAIDHLVCLFPDMDRQFLEKALEESANDLDAAIKRLNELCLSATASGSDSSHKINTQFVAKEDPPRGSSLPTNGAEWVELLVGEVLNASNVEDAKARLSQGLEALERSIRDSATLEAANNFQKENMMLKQQLEELLQENVILKRAVSIQHERQKEFDEMGKELHQLKQLISQYQEQLRTLEVNNYALAMHLKQAQQNSSLPGRFHPDIF